MKKNKVIGIIFLILMALVVIIPAITPKSYAELIKINNEEITKIKDSMVGQIYEYGTPFKIENSYYYVEYRDKYNSYIASYTFYPYSTALDENYVGYNYNSINLESYSKYWKVIGVYNYSVQNYEIVFQAIEPSNLEICNFNNAKTGDICYHDETIITEGYCDIEYEDENGQEIAYQQATPYALDYYYSYQHPSFVGYEYGYYTLIEITNAWEIKEVNKNGSYCKITFIPAKEKEIKFDLSCDKEKINYQDKTICHFTAKNYIVTEDPIILSFDGKDILELMEIVPNTYFDITKNKNNITVTTKYVSTIPEDLEIFSFEVKAAKDKNEPNNVTLKNISYYGGEEYPNLTTTIQIGNTSLPNNPLTERQTLFVKILAVGALLIISSKLLLKKKSV